LLVCVILALTGGTTFGLYHTRGAGGAILRPILHFLYLLPIGLTAHTFGLGLGLGLALFCTSLFLPIVGQNLASGVSAGVVEMLVSSALYIILGHLVGSLAEARHRQDRLQETLNLLGAVLDESLSPSALLPVILSRSAEMLGAERGEIYLRDETTGCVSLAASVGSPVAEEQEIGANEDSEEKTFPQWVLEQGEAFLSTDLPRDPRFRLATEEGGFVPRSVVAAPLRRGPVPFGLLVLEDGRKAFGQRDLYLLEAVAEKCGIAIENARLYEELQAFSRGMEERVRQRTAELAREFQRREAILRSIADGVVVADRQGRLLLCNPVASEILASLQEDVLGRPLSEVVSSTREEDPRREVFQRMAELLAAPEGLRPSPAPLRVAVGPQTWVALHTPVIGASGEVEGVVAILHDISQEIEAINARSQFVSSVAHELRVPLTSARGYGSLLSVEAGDRLTAQEQTFLGAILRSVDRMSALVEDLLDLSRLESGRVQMEIESVSLVNAVNEVVTMVRPQLEERDLALEVRLPSDLPFVLADPYRLNQILTNLVSNALRYTPSGGRVTIGGRALAPERSDRRRCPLADTPYVEVTVQDTGIGIAPEDQERIFERFVRLDHPLAEQAGGTGLGLTIVRQLLHLQEGRIWVESALGEGSTFFLTLPAAE
jgi:PAS domain S-box-containing protein